jgi:polar amino acid transport system permease protein
MTSASSEPPPGRTALVSLVPTADRPPKQAPATHLGWALAALICPPTGLPAVRHALTARELSKAGDANGARAEAVRAKEWSLYSLAAAFSVASCALAVLFLTANNHAVLDKFFNISVLRHSAPQVLRGFLLNIQLSIVAEVLVLAWALVVAIARLTPGRAGLPARVVSVIYTDLFRGLPAVIVIYLVAFGLPLTGLPIVRNFTPFQLCVLALVLVYGAYVSEVYRSGIEAIHWSQSAAARSLGLSHVQTLRFVIVPQALRRIIPPLLNDFISLQKDTALVSFVGLLDGFNRSRIVASNEFNLSAVTGVGIAFVVVTVPLARFVDYMVRRDQRRTLAG